MDFIKFYQPPSLSLREHSRLSSVRMTSLASAASVASVVITGDNERETSFRRGCQTKSCFFLSQMSQYIDTSSSHDSGTALLLALLPTITYTIDSFHSQLSIKDLDISPIT